MTSPRRTARIAGVIYLVIMITGFFSLMYVPSQLIDFSDPAVTFDNLKNDLPLYRMGIIAGLLCFLAFAVLSLVLYRLLGAINQNAAVLMVVLVLLSVPISMINLIDQINVFCLVKGELSFSSLTATQLQTEVLIHLARSRNGTLIAQIFWGLWLLPFGYLVYHSRFIPKIFGIALLIGCVGYVSDSIGYTLFPDYGDSLWSTIVGIPAGLGEVGICFWFLIAGIRKIPS